MPLADVDVAGIVLAFVEELAEREQLDLEACGEFLVLVSCLLELKARALVAGEDVDLEELDPEEAAEELARRLAEYRRFKEASQWLAERLAAERDRYFRLGPAPLAPKLEPDDRRPRSRSRSRRRCARSPSSLRPSRSRTWRSASRRSRSFSSASGRCSAGAAGSTSSRRSWGSRVVEQAVAFLALLELRKRGEAALAQAAPFAPIRVSRTREETPAVRERRTSSTLRSA